MLHHRKERFMDRIFRKLAPIVLIVLLLCGCAAPAQQQVTKQYGSGTVTVDYVKGTITFLSLIHI